MVTYVGDTGTDSSTIPQLETYTGSAWQTPYGMTLVGSANFTSATNVSFNNVFTSAYRNYFVVSNLYGSANNLAVTFRLRASGVDYSGAGYTAADITITNAGTLSGGGSTNQTSVEWTRVFAAAGVPSLQTSYIGQPQLATRKMIKKETLFNNNTSFVQQLNAYEVNAATAHDGFSLFTASGNFSGSVFIYGLRNS
jgi:hypothetical protein